MSTRQQAAMKNIGKEVNIWMAKTLRLTQIDLATARDEANQLRAENVTLKQKLKSARAALKAVPA